MKRLAVAVLGLLIVVLSAGRSWGQPPEHPFTGEILPVFYVKDVRRSVDFYHRVLACRFFHYWDYENNRPAPEWTADEPPRYAEMAVGELKFGLHFHQDADSPKSKVLIYFEVRDVDAYYRRLSGSGVEVSEMIDRPWMRFFGVEDPDGHQLRFYTRPTAGL
jgi:catechol 2,3-dioxygenase-like lactoylglutathione lyase family enzyme